MSKILFAILAICLTQVAFGRVARESAPTTTANPLIDVFNYSVEFIKAAVDGAHNATLSLAGVKNDDEFWAKAKNQFTTYENTLRSSVADLDSETKEIQGKAGDLYKAFNTKVTEVVNELKAKNPELFSGDLAKLQGVADRALRTVAEESQKLKTRLEAEGKKFTPKVEATIKQINEAVVKTAQELKTQAESAINTISKQN